MDGSGDLLPLLVVIPNANATFHNPQRLGPAPRNGWVRRRLPGASDPLRYRRRVEGPDSRGRAEFLPDLEREIVRVPREFVDQTKVDLEEGPVS